MRALYLIENLYDDESINKDDYSFIVPINNNLQDACNQKENFLPIEKCC